MKVITQHFYGTTQEWEEANNPVLYKAVWGFEETIGGEIIAKLGDGVTPWSMLEGYDIKSLSKAAQVILTEAQARQKAIEEETRAREEGQDNLWKALAGESDTRGNADSELQRAITEETQARQEADLIQLQATEHILDGVQSVFFEGAFLTRVIGGITEIPKSLFEACTVFKSGKTLINDIHGTVGVYIGDTDSANIDVKTKTTSSIGRDETPNLGTVQAHADLPTTVTEAMSLWGRTPSINDYAQVRVDETYGGFRVEWYITDIDDDGNITWGNSVVINTSDYQEQSTVNMAGKVLTGGATAGTYGEAVAIDPGPTENSDNLVSSGGVFAWVFAWFGGALNTLKTTAKTVIGAINELFDKTAKTKQYTFVIDSDAKLRQWADNAAGNDYSRVLVRSGKWMYNLEGQIDVVDIRIIDLSNGRTKSIDGEAGSIISIYVDLNCTYENINFAVVAGSENIIINNLDVQIYAAVNYINVTATVFKNCHRMRNCKAKIDFNNATCGQVSAFANCSRLYSCNGIAITYFDDVPEDASVITNAFYSCTFLYDCEGTASSGTVATTVNPFYYCRTGFGCRGRGNTRSFSMCYMEQVSGTTSWANTAAGGYNYNLTA